MHNKVEKMKSKSKEQKIYQGSRSDKRNKPNRIRVR